MDGQYPQSLPPLSSKNGKRPHWLMTGGQPEEDDVLDLGQIFSVLRRRGLLIAGVATVVTSLALVKAVTNPTYKSAFQILTRPVTAESQVVTSLPQALNSNANASRDVNNVVRGFDDTRMKLLTSSKIIQPIVDKFKPQYPELTYESLAAGISIKPVPNTEIVEIIYEDSKPEKVKAILDELSKSYLAYSLDERLADVRQGTNFIESQLPQLQKQVETGQQRLQQFRQQYNLFDPESQSRELSEQMTAFRRQRLENEVALNQIRSGFSDLQSQLAQKPDGVAATTALSQNARYQRLLEQLQTVDTQIAAESSLFVNGSPNVRVLQDQRSNLLPLINNEAQRVQDEVASQIRDLSARNQALVSTEGQLNDRMKQLSVIAREYTRIQRELQIATDNLNQFLAKREALRIDAGQRQTPWQLVAAPGEPGQSRFRTTLLLGAILGLLLGSAIALLVDKLNNIFYSPDEVKAATRLPMLGVIPTNQELDEMDRLNALPDAGGVFQRASQFMGFKPRKFGAVPFLEAFRSLYTNVRLLHSETPVRALVVSSPTPQDGKSTVALYLAQVAAAMGQRVLLVDAELRRPQLHNRLGLVNTKGLSDLVSSNLDYKQVVQQSPQDENLFILTAGQVSRDPVSLLSSVKMQQLMEQFKSAFDLVIYDTPPLIGLADANLVAAKTDGLLLVTRLGKTNRDAQKQALEGLRISPTVILGTVANDSKHHVGNLQMAYYYDTVQTQQAIGGATRR
ncbi:GumC family protein [Phormidesmis sp. 146-12]